MYQDAAPFALGTTLKGTDSDGNLINYDWLGQKFTLSYVNPGTAPLRGQKTKNTGVPFVAVPMRNTYGAALLGKRFVLRDTTAGYDWNEEVIGYSRLTAQTGIVFVDPYLDSNGVAANDIFWGIMEGVVTALTPNTNTQMNGDIAVGAKLIAATAAGTTTTLAGRVANFVLADATAAATQAMGIIGTALSARTTDNTSADILIKLCIRE